MYLKQKQELIKYSLEMLYSGLSKLTGGNVSMYLRKEKVMLITPSSTPYNQIKVEHIAELDLDGNVLNQDQLNKYGKQKSSEWEMHAVVYKSRGDVNAFIHSHPIYSMSVGAVYNKLPAIDYLIAHSGKHEILVAPYETYGSQGIAQASLDVLKDNNAVLLQNHGLNTVGKDLANAIHLAQTIEFLAEMYWRSKAIGEPNIISKEKMQEVIDKFNRSTY